MNGIIYKYVSKTTGKPYIGQTIHPTSRKEDHQKAQDDTHFHRAIQKYGFDDFEYSVVETLTANSRQELDDLLNERECYWIDYYDSFRNGYNMNPGGGHYAHNKGRIVVNNGVNQRMIQEFELSDYKKIGYVEGPLPWSDESRKECSKRNKENGNPMFGRKHSDETRAQMSKNNAMKRPEVAAKYSGENAIMRRPGVAEKVSKSQTGKHCYNNGEIEIHRRDDEEIPEGFVLGGLPKKGHTPWNKGLTKETDERVAKYGQTRKNKKKVA